ncbi:uncharacterized protein LOC129566466 [Sitodiplosis mosellana]|uniref:uncharacterized protein LOC129566466 n=1 Tax=Sitodiplosis mosellana TaxID=263140 RepID=UPI002444A90A|nr:uncharacterized protein LOC129566466 [Sitodiplosis mosellana]
MVMTRNGQKPQYELWCQQNASITRIVTKTFYVTAVMVSLLLLPPIGVIASSNFNGNNGSIATIENSTSFTNNSHYNGTINELVVSKTMQSDDNAEHVVEPSLSSLSLIRDNGSSSVVPSIDDALSRETTVLAPAMETIAAAAASRTSTTSSSSLSSSSPPPLSDAETIHTTIAPLTDGEITNRMQTSQFIASSNAQRDSPSTSSTLPITTNKPHASTFSDSMLRQKVAAHTRQYQSKHHHEHHYSGPFFEGPLNTSAGALNVGVHLYTEGVFDCRVGMLKDKTVIQKYTRKKV